MEGVLVAVAREPEVDDPVQEEQARPLVLAQGVEAQRAPGRSVARASHAGVDDHGASEFLGSGREVQSVEALHVVCRPAAHFLGGGDEIDGVGRRIDDRRPSDTDLIGDVSVSPVSAAGTVVTPAVGLVKFTCHSGLLLLPSASKAYTLSCSVATITMLWYPCPGMFTFSTYSGEANVRPSGGS